MAPGRPTDGDEARIAIELLWRPRRPAGRGPKATLDLDRIVTAGMAIADRDGLDAVSMRAVARELGHGTMSLYRHVPGKRELLDLMFDRAVGETVPQTPPEGNWRDRLEALAWHSWEGYQRHPWLLRISHTRPPLGPNVLDSYETLLRAVDGVGLTGAEMNAMVTLVSDFVSGAARRTLDAAAAERASGESDEHWWLARTSFWDEFFDAERYATIARIYEEGGYDATQDPFAAGLEVVLDGIEARIERRRAPSSAAGEGDGTG